MGCDQQPALPRIKMHIFQSTHPVWDATRDIANEYARCLFQSTHPVWDATDVVVSSDLVHGISIHASRMGCDIMLAKEGKPKEKFQSTHPVWDATSSWLKLHSLTLLISIHASRMGCDWPTLASQSASSDFNPRIPYGMRHGDLAVGVGRGGISIHASRMGCDVLHHVVGGGIGISIHASRMGCDTNTHERCWLADRFQSTHPVWDATPKGQANVWRLANFNPRIPYGMRLAKQNTKQAGRRISIHASRMGCDSRGVTRGSVLPNFNPRIPYGMRLSRSISPYIFHHFNPRIPYGMRLAKTSP